MGYESKRARSLHRVKNRLILKQLSWTGWTSPKCTSPTWKKDYLVHKSKNPQVQKDQVQQSYFQNYIKSKNPQVQITTSPTHSCTLRHKSNISYWKKYIKSNKVTAKITSSPTWHLHVLTQVQHVICMFWHKSNISFAKCSLSPTSFRLVWHKSNTNTAGFGTSPKL